VPAKVQFQSSLFFMTKAICYKFFRKRLYKFKNLFPLEAALDNLKTHKTPMTSNLNQW